MSEFEFQKKALLSIVKRKFHEEQPVIDILHQLHGPDLQEVKGDVDDFSSLGTRRIRVLDALLIITPSTLDEGRRRRITAIEAIVALGQVQDGHQFPVRARDVAQRSVERTAPPMNTCKQTQCFLCLGNLKAALHIRTKEFHSKGDLKKHLLRVHVRRMHYGQPIMCPLDGKMLQDGQQVLRHAHHVHKTPIAY